MPEAVWTPAGGGSPGGIRANISRMRGLGPGGGGGDRDSGIRDMMERLLKKKIATASAKRPKTTTAQKATQRWEGANLARAGVGPAPALSVGPRGASARQRSRDQMAHEDTLRTMLAKKAQPFVQGRMSNIKMEAMSPVGNVYKEAVNPAGYGYDDTDFLTSRGLATGGNPMQRFQGHGSSTPVGGSIGAGGTTSSQMAVLKKKLEALGK